MTSRMVHEIKTLKEAITPILWLNCIFCMGVFEIPVNRPRPLFSIAYVVSILIGYLFMFYQGIIIFQENFGNNYIIFYFVIMINIMVATLAVILFWQKCEVCSRILTAYSVSNNFKILKRIKSKTLHLDLCE